MMRPVRATLALLAWAIPVLLAGGCSRPWQFAPAAPTPLSTASLTTRPTEKVAVLPYGGPPPAELVRPVTHETAASPAPASLPPVQPSPSIPWPATTMPREPAQWVGYEAPLSTPWPSPSIARDFPSTEALAEPPVYTPLESPVLDSAPPTTAALPPSGPSFWTPPSRLGAYWGETKGNVIKDYRHYYSWRTAIELGVGVGLAAPLANTSLDHDFREWYQRDVRSSDSDDLSSFWKPWGEGKYFIPAWAGLAVVGKIFEDRPVFNLAGEFGDRTSRGYLVGAPPMLLMQYTLGASRPGETADTSHWKPFDDTNAVSGHAFIGAMPFLTAANMVENPWAKGAFYALSTFPAWSRVNDDRHYLSQVCLGWYMAYLAAKAVDQTEHVDDTVRIVPLATRDMTGLGFVFQR